MMMFAEVSENSKQITHFQRELFCIKKESIHFVEYFGL
jgi:hypothetical protein